MEAITSIYSISHARLVYCYAVCYSSQLAKRDNGDHYNNIRLYHRCPDLLPNLVYPTGIYFNTILPK